jgi:3-hydroxyisobutyrate dehydrogenase-like beta-hydroxyacid dehydrogenase
VLDQDPAPRPPDGPRVGVLGGDERSAAMVVNLVRAGHDVRVWDQREPATGADAETVPPGAVRALSASGAAAGASVLVVRLPDFESVRTVLFGGDDPVADVLSGDAVVVDTSPLGPRDARSVSRELDRRGIRGLDASVSGTVRQAVDGTLATHVGGDPETLEEVRGVLESWTAPGRLTWAGGPGCGAGARVVASAATALSLQTVGELLRLGRDLDLSRSVVLEVLLAGPLGALVAGRDRRLREQDPGSSVAEATDRLDEVLAELSLALMYAGAALPALEGAYLNARLAVADGGAADDVVALALAREGLAHLTDADLQPEG